MRNIGLSASQIETGKEVYYYPWKDRHSNAEPVKTKIKSKVYDVGGQKTCFVEGVSGVVAISHLSFEYYPEKILTRAQAERKERYQKYLRSDSSLSFIDWLKNKNYERY